MKTIEVELTFLEEILGTSPSNKDIYEDFIGSKAPDAASLEEEIAALGADVVVEKGMTVFARDEQGRPCLFSYHIKGHFKDACSMLKKVPGTKSSKLKAHKKEIDGLIFVNPLGDSLRLIPLIAPEGYDKMEVCQRPLRAETMQGPRVALAMSESMPIGTKCQFEVTCFVDEDLDLVREWLDYGRMRGIGQWRNSGKGRYVWKELRCY